MRVCIGVVSVSSRRHFVAHILSVFDKPSNRIRKRLQLPREFLGVNLSILVERLSCFLQRRRRAILRLL